MSPNLSNYLWIVLYPLAVAWSVLTFLRRKLCEGQGYRSKLPVVCVGNLHSGGSSKTPIVIELAIGLKEKMPVVVSRGYRRKSTVKISAVDLSNNEGALRFGDEPWLIANEARVPVWVGANRGRVAAETEAAGHGKLLILDDGFQNFTLKKTISLVCIAADKKLSDSHTLPLGTLRESLQALRSAEAVFLVRGNDEKGFQRWREYLEIQFPALPCFEVTPNYTASESIRSGKWIAFSGIAGPERFQQTLSELNCDCETSVFEDHHTYSMRDVERLISLKEQHEAAGFVTTQKDYYKAVEVFEKFNEKLEFVKMRVKIEDRFWKFLEDRLRGI